MAGDAAGVSWDIREDFLPIILILTGSISHSICVHSRFLPEPKRSSQILPGQTPLLSTALACAVLRAVRAVTRAIAGKHEESQGLGHSEERMLGAGAPHTPVLWPPLLPVLGQHGTRKEA